MYHFRYSLNSVAKRIFVLNRNVTFVKGTKVKKILEISPFPSQKDGVSEGGCLPLPYPGSTPLKEERTGSLATQSAGLSGVSPGLRGLD